MARTIAGLDDSAEGGRAPERRSGGSEWGVLASLGLAFAVVSLTDVALTFYPVGLGSPEWEFSTATAVMNNLPLAVVGLGLMGVAGMARDSEGLTRFAAVMSAALMAMVLVMGVFFARNTGAALASVTDPLLSQGLKEAITRTAVQLVAYLGGLGWLVWRLWKR
jgi:hypothetical protein